jgi:hypothetical protein
MTRIVTYVHRYKRPPRKKKAVALAGQGGRLTAVTVTAREIMNRLRRRRARTRATTYTPRCTERGVIWPA